MQKRKMKKLMFFLAVCMMMGSSISANGLTLDVKATEVETTEALSVSFVNQYAEVGVALSAETNATGNVSYSWYVGGENINNTTASYIPTAEDLEKWIQVDVISGTEQASAKMYCSKLPVVYIDTENGAAITSKEEYINANIKVQGNAQYNNSKQLYNGLTEIRGRGNSTWSQPKKPYRLKLDKKTDMFGMGEGTKSKHWVLLANYLDESLLRNTLAYDMSGEMGMEHLSTVWVDVVMNGEYVGNYQFCENVRVDEDRVDIFDWESFAEDVAAVVAEAEGMDENATDDLTEYMAEKSMQWITSQNFDFNGKSYNLSTYESDLLTLVEEGYGHVLENIEELSSLITGGYILELDEYYDEVSKFKTNSNQPMMFKNPEFVYTNTDMFNYVQNYVQAFENAVQSDDYTAMYDGNKLHYSELYDFEELIDYWLVTEIFYNEEINKKSTYMYKDVDGLMIMGPIWDMDWSSGAAGTSAGATDQWATNRFSSNAQANQWYKDIIKDPYFLMKAQERYWEIRNDEVQGMLDQVDVHIDYLKESGQADYETWLAKANRGTSFASDSANLKNWLNNHVAWMDAQMATEDSLVNGFFTPSSAIVLTLNDKNGVLTAADVETIAPADALIGTDDDVVVKISATGLDGTAQVFVNGKIAGTVPLSNGSAQYVVSSALLTEAVDEKNIIEVKVKNNANTVSASNYVTVKRTDCVHVLAEQWESDAEYHWNECKNNCGYKSVMAKHTFQWVTDREASKEQVGLKHEECTVCRYRRSENTEFEYVEAPEDPSDSSKDISVKNMVAISQSECACSSTEGSDDYVLDGNPDSYWHTDHGGENGPGTKLENRWVGVSLNETMQVNGIRFLPRQNNGNGQVAEYEIQYRTSDEGEWITIKGGNWDTSDGNWKYVGFESVMAKQVRIVGVHTVSNGSVDRHMTCAEFRVTGVEIDAPSTDEDVNNSPEIPVSQMSVTAGDYEPEDKPSNAIDEDETTIWHTNWNVGPNHDDHWLQIELKNVYKVDGFKYLPRVDESKNGMITEYEIYTSLDGTEWTKATAGEWNADKVWKTVVFDAVDARYVKLVTLDALTENNSLKFASAAEVRLTGTLDGEVVIPPEETLEVAFVNGYAEVGTPLTVDINGAEDVTYSWKVDGKVVSTTASYIPTANDLETWIEVTVSAENKSATAKMYCSKLPVVYINTENGQAITSKENYINADMKVQGNAEFNEDSVLYDNVIEIRGRGNSTWSQPKKPYRMKLDKKTNMFNMGKSKHWVLLANYLDESLLRNTLAYDLSGSMGMEQMSTVWVDVVMNGEYVGNYQFCENIRIEDTRVDIFDWEGFAEEAAEIIAEAESMNEDTTDDLIDYMVEESMLWITTGYVDFNNKRYHISDYADIIVPSITGGYLLELDEYYDEVSKFKTNSNQPIMFKNPEFVYTNTEMMNYVQNYVQAFENAVQSSNYMAEYEGEDVHYSELYDFEALVDYWLISEVFYNEELNKKSTYMYKDLEGLMMMGPIWDMDWSSGAAGTSAGATNQWATNYFKTNAQANQWYKYLVQDPYFLIRAQERYWEIRDAQLQDMLDSMDVHYTYLKESGAADYETWLSKAGRTTSFESDYNNLNNWMNKHVAWMDGQMATEDSFDVAFLNKNESLILMMTEVGGVVLETPEDGKAPADVVAPEDKTLELQMSGVNGTAKIFVNGRECATTAINSNGTKTLIEAEWMNAVANKKNVIEVKVYNTYENMIAENYITVTKAQTSAEKVPVTEIFIDVVEGAWYVDSVQYVYDEKMIIGDGNVFAPNGSTTRAMVAVILYRLSGSPGVTDYTLYNRFTDLPKKHLWYSDAVAWALNENVSTGDDVNMRYNPNLSVTREQLALFLWRYAQYKGEDVTVNATEEELFGGTFVNKWAKEGFAWAVDRGVIRGSESTGADGQIHYELLPQGGATRAQLAKMLYRYFGGATE